VVGGGGGGPVARGGIEQVVEYQWRARKVAAGVVGHEEGRRRGLGGELGGGGGHGGGGGRSWQQRLAGRGARAQGGRRDG